MAREIAYPTPGEILQEEFLTPMGITAYRLAQDTHIPQQAISEIIRGTRSVSVSVGLRLSRYFGTSDEFWTGLQLDHDTAVMKDELREQLDAIEPAHA